MPLVFVHGVNTRDTDEDYVRSVAARRTMVEQYIVPKLAKRGLSGFAVEDDIYWGDLGVSFGWNLRSIPEIKVLQSLGPEAEQNLDLVGLVLDARKPAEDVQSLGATTPLVEAAEKTPGALVRAVFAPEAEKFAPRVTGTGTQLSKEEAEKANDQGEHLGLMLIAVESLARDADANPKLIHAQTDGAVLDKIGEQITDRYRALVSERLAQVDAGEVQHLGNAGNPIGWVTDHIGKMIGAAKSVAKSAVAEAERAGSLLLLKQVRTGISRAGLRFLGDVFVYLQRGRNAAPSINARVKEGLLRLKEKKRPDGKQEPLIIITHSFGSEIVYDLLISGALSELNIDLWVTVGAQTSLFAEMLLFEKLPKLPADTSTFVLSRPENVKKWINFYDAADVLSFLHEPVFGKDAVTDIEATGHGNVANAHGHYFVDPEFYQRIAAEI